MVCVNRTYFLLNNKAVKSGGRLYLATTHTWKMVANLRVALARLQPSWGALLKCRHDCRPRANPHSHPCDVPKCCCWILEPPKISHLRFLRARARARLMRSPVQGASLRRVSLNLNKRPAQSSLRLSPGSRVETVPHPPEFIGAYPVV